MEHFLGKAGQGKVFWRACSGTQIAKVRNISIWPTEGLSKIISRVYENSHFVLHFKRFELRIDIFVAKMAMNILSKSNILSIVF